MGAISNRDASQNLDPFQERKKQLKQAKDTIQKYRKYIELHPDSKDRLIWDVEGNKLVIRQLNFSEKFWNFLGFNMGVKLTQINEQLKKIDFDINDENLKIIHAKYITRHIKPIPNDNKDKLGVLKHNISVIAKFPAVADKYQEVQSISAVQRAFKELPIQDQFNLLEKTIIEGKKGGEAKRLEVKFLIKKITEFEFSSGYSHNGKQLTEQDRNSIKNLLAKLISQGIENNWEIGHMLQPLISHFRTSFPGDGKIDIPKDLCRAPFDAKYKQLGHPPKLQDIRTNIELLSKFTDQQIPENNKNRQILSDAIDALPLKDSLTLAQEAVPRGKSQEAKFILKNIQFTEFTKDSVSAFFNLFSLLKNRGDTFREVLSHIKLTDAGAESLSGLIKGNETDRASLGTCFDHVKSCYSNHHIKFFTQVYDTAFPEKLSIAQTVELVTAAIARKQDNYAGFLLHTNRVDSTKETTPAEKSAFFALFEESIKDYSKDRATSCIHEMTQLAAQLDLDTTIALVKAGQSLNELGRDIFRAALDKNADDTIEKMKTAFKYPAYLKILGEIVTEATPGTFTRARELYIEKARETLQKCDPEIIEYRDPYNFSDLSYDVGVDLLRNLKKLQALDFQHGKIAPENFKAALFLYIQNKQINENLDDAYEDLKEAATRMPREAYRAAIDALKKTYQDEKYNAGLPHLNNYSPLQWLDICAQTMDVARGEFEGINPAVRDDRLRNEIVSLLGKNQDPTAALARAKEKAWNGGDYLMHVKLILNDETFVQDKKLQGTEYKKVRLLYDQELEDELRQIRELASSDNSQPIDLVRLRGLLASTTKADLAKVRALLQTASNLKALFCIGMAVGGIDPVAEIAKRSALQLSQADIQALKAAYPEAAAKVDQFNELVGTNLALTEVGQLYRSGDPAKAYTDLKAKYPKSVRSLDGEIATHCCRQLEQGQSLPIFTFMKKIWPGNEYFTHLIDVVGAAYSPRRNPYGGLLEDVPGIAQAKRELVTHFHGLFHQKDSDPSDISQLRALASYGSTRGLQPPYLPNPHLKTAVCYAIESHNTQRFAGEINLDSGFRGTRDRVLKLSDPDFQSFIIDLKKAYPNRQDITDLVLGLQIDHLLVNNKPAALNALKAQYAGTPITSDVIDNQLKKCVTRQFSMPQYTKSHTSTLTTLRLIWGEDFMKNYLACLSQASPRDGAFKALANDIYRQIKEMVELPGEATINTVHLKMLLAFYNNNNIKLTDNSNWSYSIELATANLTANNFLGAVCIAMHANPEQSHITNRPAKKAASAMSDAAFATAVTQLKALYSAPNELEKLNSLLIELSVDQALDSTDPTHQAKVAIQNLKAAYAESSDTIDQLILEKLKANLMSSPERAQKAIATMNDLWTGDEYFKNFAAFYSKFDPYQRNYPVVRSATNAYFAKIETMLSEIAPTKENLEQVKKLLNESRRLDYFGILNLKPKTLQGMMCLLQATPENTERYLDQVTAVVLDTPVDKLSDRIKELREIYPQAAEFVKEVGDKSLFERMLVEATSSDDFAARVVTFRAANPEMANRLEAKLEEACVTALSRNTSAEKVLAGLRYAWPGDSYWKNLGKALVNVSHVSRSASLEAGVDSYFEKIAELIQGQPATEKNLSLLKAMLISAHELDPQAVLNLKPSSLKEAMCLLEAYPAQAKRYKEMATTFILGLSDEAREAILQENRAVYPSAAVTVKQVADETAMERLLGQRLTKEQYSARIAAYRVANPSKADAISGLVQEACIAASHRNKNTAEVLAGAKHAWQGKEYWQNLGAILAGTKRDTNRAIQAARREYFAEINALITTQPATKENSKQIKTLLHLAKDIDRDATMKLMPKNLQEAMCLIEAMPERVDCFDRAKTELLKLPEDQQWTVLQGLKEVYPSAYEKMKKIAEQPAIERVLGQLSSQVDFETLVRANKFLTTLPNERLNELVQETCKAALSRSVTPAKVLTGLKQIWKEGLYLRNLGVLLAQIPEANRGIAFKEGVRELMAGVKAALSDPLATKEKFELFRTILKSARAVDYAAVMRLNPKNLREAMFLAEATPEEADGYFDEARTFTLQLSEDAIKRTLNELQAILPKASEKVKEFFDKGAFERVLVQATSADEYTALIESYKAANRDKADKIDSLLQETCVAALSRATSATKVLAGLKHAWKGDGYWKKLGEALVSVPFNARGDAFIEAKTLFFNHITRTAAEGKPNAAELDHLKTCMAEAQKLDVAFVSSLEASNFKSAIYYALLVPNQIAQHTGTAIQFAVSFEGSAYSTLIADFKENLPKARDLITDIDLKKIWTDKLKANPRATLGEMRQQWQGDEYWRNFGVVLAQTAKMQPRSAELDRALVVPIREFFTKTTDLLKASGSAGHDIALLKNMLTNAHATDPIRTAALKPTTISQAFCLSFALPLRASDCISKGVEKAKTMKENAYTTELQTLKTCYPQLVRDVNDFDFSVRYSLDKTHLAASSTDLVIPEKPAGFSVDQLMGIYDGVNFHDSTKEPYYDPVVEFRSDMDTSNPANVSKEALRKQMSLFVERIQRKTAYLGTPTEGSEALKTYYDTMEKAITNVLKKLNQLGNTPDAQAKKAKMIKAFIIASTHCGTASYTASLKLFKEIVQGKSPNYKEDCLEALTEFRGIVAEGIPPQGHESIEHFKRLMLVLGQKLKLPMANLFTAQAGLASFGDMGFDEARDEALFWGRYSASAAYSWVADGINGGADERQKCIDWLKANMFASWSGKANFDAIGREAAASRKTAGELIKWLSDEKNIDVQIKDPEIDVAITASVDKHFTKQINDRKKYLRDKTKEMNTRGKSADEIAAQLKTDTLQWLRAQNIPTARNLNIPIATIVRGKIDDAIEKLANKTLQEKADLKKEVLNRLRQEGGSFTAVLAWLKNEKQITPDVAAELAAKADDLVSSHVEVGSSQFVPLVTKMTDSDAIDKIEEAIDSSGNSAEEKEALKTESFARLKQYGESLSKVLAWLSEKGIRPAIQPSAVTAADNQALEACIASWSELVSQVAKNRVKQQKFAGAPYNEIIADLKAKKVPIDVSDRKVAASTKKAIETAIRDASEAAFLEEITETRPGSEVRVVKSEYIAKMLAKMQVLAPIRFA